jgi:aspartate carbamoyltransferase
MNNFLTLADFSVNEIEALINKGLTYKKTNKFPNYQDKYISNLFFENSTRTKSSFEMAQRRLGCQVIPFDASTSSVQKGETLYDTCRTLEYIGVDALVIRDRGDKYYEELVGKIGIPIINAGDGTGSHPSQSLLDLMTIIEQFGTIEGKHIVIAGDVLHSRVAHSNIEIMQRMGATVSIAAPKQWREHNISNVNFVHLDEIIDDVDVVMLLRIQHERHTDNFDTSNFLAEHGLTKARANRMKKTAIIMHPAPINRNVEIAEELIEAPNSRIFEQMRNGSYARMAILDYVFKK